MLTFIELFIPGVINGFDIDLIYFLLSFLNRMFVNNLCNFIEEYVIILTSLFKAEYSPSILLPFPQAQMFHRN